MRSIKAIILVLGLLVSSLGMAADKEKPKILADKTESTENGLRAVGHVEVKWGEYRIYAENAEYNEKTREIVARGRVTMASADTVISGDQLRFNLAEKKGEMYDVQGLIPPTVQYKADKVDQVDNDTLKFNKMRFTSCAQLVPRWSITCSGGKIKKEKYVDMKNAVLRIKKIPIFYLPYLRYPIQKDGRATGFLFPKIGNSSMRGFFVSNSFFWDIKSNLDLTLYLDYFSKVGLGLGEEFRYLFKNMSGSINYYRLNYFSDNTFQDQYVFSNSPPEERPTYDYYINAEHVQSFDFLNTNIAFKIDNQSDPNFLRIFDTNFDRVFQARYGYSFHVTSSLSNVNVSVKTSSDKIFYILRDNFQKTKYLPSVDLNVNQQKIWKIPGYFSLSASYDRIERTGIILQGQPQFDTGIPSRRLVISPSYTLDLLKLPWLSTTVEVSSRQAFYANSRDPETQKVLEEPLHLQYQQASVELKGPVFYKIYDSRKSKIKHLIEPKINIRYVTGYSEEDNARLLRVDYSDYPSYSYVGFSLSTRLLYKKKGDDQSPIDILTLTTSQKYYFDPEVANFNLKIDGKSPEFSELDNSLRLRFSDNFSLDSRLSYNYYIKRFRSLYVRLNFSDRYNRIGGSFGYSSFTNPFFLGVANEFNRQVIRGDLSIDFPGFPIKLQGGIDYDITDKDFRYSSVVLKYDYQCVHFNFEFKLFKRLDTIDSQFRFGISFGNLGMVSDFLGDSRQ